MSANIIRLLPDQEQALLACYVTGSKQLASFQELYGTMEVPTNAEPDRLQMAVLRYCCTMCRTASLNGPR